MRGFYYLNFFMATTNILPSAEELRAAQPKQRDALFQALRQALLNGDAPATTARYILASVQDDTETIFHRCTQFDGFVGYPNGDSVILTVLTATAHRARTLLQAFTS